MVNLARIYTPSATLGVLRIADPPLLFECAILELPWRDNAIGKSCIPEGEYVMRQRRSAVVERTTNGEYQRGWEIVDVPGRTFIMLHPGNVPAHTEGCLLPGSHHKTMNRQLAVHDSLRTYRQLAALLDARAEWGVTIRGVNSHA